MILNATRANVEAGKEPTENMKIYAIRLVRPQLLQVQAQVEPRHVHTDPGLYASSISTTWLFDERVGASSSGSKCLV